MRRPRATSYVKNGFTLMELLVVITIIAVLASLLMPAINMVREASKRSVCASNQRQLGMALSVYADEYDRMVPLLYNETNKQSNYYIYYPGTTNLLLGGLGMLYAAGALDTERVWYCPGQRGPSFQRNASNNPWPGQAGSKTRSSYSTRPMTTFRADGFVGVLPMTQNLTAKAVLTDLSDIAKDVQTGHRSGINSLYLDGHVTYIGSTVLAPGFSQIIVSTSHSAANNPAMDTLWTALDGR